MSYMFTLDGNDICVSSTCASTRTLHYVSKASVSVSFACLVYYILSAIRVFTGLALQAGCTISGFCYVGLHEGPLSIVL